MFVLIILLSYEFSNTSQQIEFKTRQGCETAVSGVLKQNYVKHAFCVQKD